MSKKLTKKQIATELKKLHSDWVVNSDQTVLSKKFSFKNYIEGFMFVTRVSVHSQVVGHHPDVLLTYSSVKISLTSHELKSLTMLDFDLAKKFDDIYHLSTTKTKN